MLVERIAIIPVWRVSDTAESDNRLSWNESFWSGSHPLDITTLHQCIVDLFSQSSLHALHTAWVGVGDKHYVSDGTSPLAHTSVMERSSSITDTILWHVVVMISWEVCAPIRCYRAPFRNHLRSKWSLYLSIYQTLNTLYIELPRPSHGLIFYPIGLSSPNFKVTWVIGIWPPPYWLSNCWQYTLQDTFSQGYRSFYVFYFFLFFLHLSTKRVTR